MLFLKLLAEDHIGGGLYCYSQDLCHMCSVHFLMAALASDRDECLIWK